MNVLFLTQVFPPEEHPTAVMVAELAERLSAAGHGVTVACGLPHHPLGRPPAEYQNRLIIEEKRGDVSVLRGWHLTSSKRAIPARAAVMASQSLTMGLRALAADPPDVVVSYGPPILGPIVSAAVARRFRAKLLTVIYDIYPDIAIETGALRNPLLIRAARFLEQQIYRRSDKVLVLAEGFRRSLQDRGVATEKIEVVPVWLDDFGVHPRENAWRREQGISPDKLVVLYAGTLGLVSGAVIMADVVERLRQYPDCLFLFVGEGAAKDQLQAELGSKGLSNYKFLPFQPRERLGEVQAAADISLVTLAPGRGRTSVPSKVVGYMAAARPVLASVDLESDTGSLIAETGCGIVRPAGDSTALAAAILELRAAPDQRRRMGEAGRDAYLARFSRATVLNRYVRMLEAMVSA